MNQPMDDAARARFLMAQRVFSAAQSHDPAGLIELIEAGADVQGHDDLGSSPLIRACSGYLGWLSEGPSKACLEFLIGAGADLDFAPQGEYGPLATLCTQGDSECAGILLDAGADIDAITGPDGETPLMRALRDNRQETTKLLIDRGANLELPDADGERPLMRAAAMSIYCAHLGVLEQLLAAGADIDARDVDGDTALAYGARAGNAEECVSLLRAGANPRPTRSGEKDAASLASEAGHIDCAAAILSCQEHMILSAHSPEEQPCSIPGKHPRL